MGAVALDSLPGPRIGPLGTPERDWTEWLAGIPRRPLDAILPANSRLVVLAPHPDDEILACAGMLALHGARGGASLIIAATDGEASHAGCSRTYGSRGSDRNPAASLGQVRRSESADGLRRLALQRCAVLRLGLPDGGLRQCQTALQDQLQAQLSPTDTLLTTWRGDAHPDHESCGLAAAAAARSFGCRLLEAPVWLWHWSRPGDRRVPWERLVGLELAPDVVARKASALAAHRSQLTPRDAATGPVLGLDMVRRAGRPTEFFFAEM